MLVVWRSCCPRTAPESSTADLEECNQEDCPNSQDISQHPSLSSCRVARKGHSFGRMLTRCIFLLTRKGLSIHTHQKHSPLQKCSFQCILQFENNLLYLPGQGRECLEMEIMNSCYFGNPSVHSRTGRWHLKYPLTS
jgi:hypothetical protein